LSKYNFTRLKFTYRAKNFLFIKKIYIKDSIGNIIKFELDYFKDIRRKVLDGGNVEEIIDILLSVKQIENLNKLFQSSPITVRFYGKDYYEDYFVKNKEINNIIEFLEV
jgi:hypothetical protein